MQVRISNRLWRMGEKEFEKLLSVAKEQVKFGVYAIKKNDYVEMRNDVCQSKTQLKKLIREYKARGFKVYYNG